MKGFLAGFFMKQRQRKTRKWPITTWLGAKETAVKECKKEEKE